MKNLLKWLPCLLFAICSCAFIASCKSDLEDHSKIYINAEIKIFVNDSKGSYIGKVYTNDNLTSDNIKVRLIEVADSILSVEAPFLDEDKNGANFRIEKKNDKFIFRNDALEGFSIYIEADSLFIDYTNNVQDVISYRGKKIE